MKKSVIFTLSLLIIVLISGCTITEESFKPSAPFDSAVAEVTVLPLIEAINLPTEVYKLSIDKILVYNRYPGADYPKLNEDDKKYIRIYEIVEEKTTAGSEAIKEGEESLPIIKSTPIINKKYKASLNYCAEGIGGIECMYEGWSAALYPIDS